MDSFEKCRLASEKVCWPFEETLKGLEFDFSKKFLPDRLCGHALPSWLSQEANHTLNQLRGFSYAHIFLFVEEFIIPLTFNSAHHYIHKDKSALSAMLRFAEEEVKHQRMFDLMKDLLQEGFGFRPREISDKEGVAKTLGAKNIFALYLVTLALEFLTQRHYIECFHAAENELDPGFVKIFRLHWTEEAQHTRIDALEIRALALQMSDSEILLAVEEFLSILQILQQLIAEQDAMDIINLEQALNRTFDTQQRMELLEALNKEFLWTFILSGLEHLSFQAIFKEVVPSNALSVNQVIENLNDKYLLASTA